MKQFIIAVLALIFSVNLYGVEFGCPPPGDYKGDPIVNKGNIWRLQLPSNVTVSISKTDNPVLSPGPILFCDGYTGNNRRLNGIFRMYSNYSNCTLDKAKQTFVCN